MLPAHEEQGPDYWDLKPSPRQKPFGAHTALTREPDAIDLFCAETGASLAETIHLLGDRLAPEVVQHVRQEVERRIFKPYLAYGRKHWWYRGALNWNGVCNGSIGLAFLRLERDPQTLAEAIEQVLEGFDAYIATGFEADGGSIEGIGYWNYGLMYYVTVAELLRERTGGKLDLLAAPRLRDIARYPLAAALSPGRYLNFGDAEEPTALSPGVVQRLAERTGVDDLRGLISGPRAPEGRGVPTAKLAIVLRDAAWWDGVARPFPAAARQDATLPDSGVIRLTGQTTDGRPVALATKAGHNDGHHSHADVATFILHVDGESLLCDPGRGKYSKEYFRLPRYENIFCNSFGHGVPVIGGRLQAPGPEFGGHQQYHGTVVATEVGPDDEVGHHRLPPRLRSARADPGPSLPAAQSQERRRFAGGHVRVRRRGARHRGGVRHLAAGERRGRDGAHRRQALDADAHHPGAGGRNLHGHRPGGRMPDQRTGWHPDPFGCELAGRRHALQNAVDNSLTTKTPRHKGHEETPLNLFVPWSSCLWRVLILTENTS